MDNSIVPLAVSLVYAIRFRKFAKINKLPQWEKLFRNALFFAAFLFAVEAIMDNSDYTKWLWHLFLMALIFVPFRQQEFRAMRNYIIAFMPYVLVSLIYDFCDFFTPIFFKSYEAFYKNAIGLTFIWLLATLYSQNRQFKAAEKERIKRAHEDELNRAIALRKVELEELVTERTAELTKQKEELELTLEELKTTQSQLIQSEKMASLGELTAGIAHEIQTPLNSDNNVPNSDKSCPVKTLV